MACPIPWSPSTAVSRADRAGPRQTAKPMRFDPSSPGLLPGWRTTATGWTRPPRTLRRHAQAQTHHQRKDMTSDERHRCPKERRPAHHRGRR